MNGRTLGVMAALSPWGNARAGVAAGGASTTAGPYKLAGTFGKPGTGNGQFSGAKGIAVAANGNVYIADSNNNRIEVFSKSGAFRSKWGTIGTANGQFTGAQDVAIGPDGSVWVADDGNARAQGFSATGGWKSLVTTQNESARAVAVDSAGDVYVAAEGGSRAGFRVFPGGNGDGAELLGAGEYSLLDVEASPDGTVLLVTAASNTADARCGASPRTESRWGALAAEHQWNRRRFRLQHLDRRLQQPRHHEVLADGRRLATAAYTDLQAQDIAVAKNGDVYVTQLNGPISTSRSTAYSSGDRVDPGAADGVTRTGGEDRVLAAAASPVRP